MFKRYGWVFLVMLPVGAMVGFLAASVVTYVMPKKYESDATIEIRPRPSSSLDGAVPPTFLGTQFEKITSRNTLMRVVDALELTNRWGLDRNTAVQILKQIITVENIRGTDLYTIKARHTNKEDARDIVAETARAFRDELMEEADKEISKSINAYKKVVREREDVVEERRKVLTTILRNMANDEAEEIDGVDGAVSAHLDRQDYLDAQRDFETEQGLLEQLKLKLISAEIDADLQADVIIVHDDPIISDAPISPNVTLNLLIGLLGGTLLSPFLALPVMWMLNRKHVSAEGF